MQDNFDFNAIETAELGEFCYIRPRKGDQDYDQWRWCGEFAFRAFVRNGRESDEALYVEVRAYADDLHSGLVAMRFGELMVGRDEQQQVG
jgi:hypothetical protein